MEFQIQARNATTSETVDVGGDWRFLTFAARGEAEEMRDIVADKCAKPGITYVVVDATDRPTRPRRNRNGALIDAYVCESGVVRRNAFTTNDETSRYAGCPVVVTATYLPAMQDGRLVWRRENEIVNHVTVDVGQMHEGDLDGVELTQDEYALVNEQLNNRFATFEGGLMQGRL